LVLLLEKLCDTINKTLVLNYSVTKIKEDMIVTEEEFIEKLSFLAFNFKFFFK